MDTRLRKKLRAGCSRMHYQQFDCSSSSTDDELSEVMLPIPPLLIDADQVEPQAPSPMSDQSISPTRELPQLFSDHEHARSLSPQITASEKEHTLPQCKLAAAVYVSTPVDQSITDGFPQQLPHLAHCHTIASQLYQYRQ